MKQYLLSQSSYLIIILFVSSFVQTFAQSNVYIFRMGGANYIPMKNFSHFINQLSNHKVDEIGFNGIFGIKYALTDNHKFLISSEILNKNASFSADFTGGTTWNFKVIPVAIGYQYLFSNKGSNFRPFAGMNISYCFIEIETDYYTDTPRTPSEITKRNKFGIEPNFGFSYKITDSFSILSEIKYRYISDAEFWLKDVNLSGLLLNLGIQIKVL